MIRKNMSLICAVVLIFLFLCISPRMHGQGKPAPQVSSQIKTEDGLDMAGFDTLNGRVEVALPEDMSNGDIISGTVITEPKGESKEEIAENQDKLCGYVVEIDKCQEVKEPKKPFEEQATVVASVPPPHRSGTLSQPPEDVHRSGILSQPPAEGHQPGTLSVPPPVITKEKPTIPIDRKKKDSHFTCWVTPEVTTCTIILKTTDGEEVCRRDVSCKNQHKPVKPITSNDARFPNSGTCGKRVAIPGSYDGRSYTSRVTINGHDTAVIAESPGTQVVQMPENCSGSCNIESSECGYVKKGIITLLPSTTVARRPEPKAATPAPSAVNLSGAWDATYTTIESSFPEYQAIGQCNSCKHEITQAGKEIVIGPTAYPFIGTVDGVVVTGKQTLTMGTTSIIKLTYDPASGQLLGECTSTGPGIASRPQPWRLVKKVVMHRCSP